MSPFDIVAELEGYLAVFRFDEFKMLSKKEPQLVILILFKSTDIDRAIKSQRCLGRRL